jgi:hypothetical protein
MWVQEYTILTGTLATPKFRWFLDLYSRHMGMGKTYCYGQAPCVARRFRDVPGQLISILMMMMMMQVGIVTIVEGIAIH